MTWMIKYLGKRLPNNKILSTSEIKRMRPSDRVFVEHKGGVEILSFDAFHVQEMLNGYHTLSRYAKSEYAKTWRCWERKPIISESKSVPWII